MVGNFVPSMEDKKRTEAHFIEICIRESIKYKSKQYMDFERMFFCGAMTISKHLFQHWAICLATRRPIISKEEYK